MKNALRSLALAVALAISGANGGAAEAPFDFAALRARANA